MQFNPEDKSISIISDIDFLLFGDGSVFNTEYSLIDRTRNINITLDDTIAELFKADPTFMWDDTTNPDFPIATLDLEQRDSFVLPDASLVVNRVRIKDQNGKYMTLTPILRRQAEDSELDSTGIPQKYYKIDNAIFLVPAPNYSATDGIELEFQRGANHFTTADTTKTPGFASQFHQALSIGAALRYAMSNGLDKKIAYLTGERDRIKLAIANHYQTRAKDEKPKLSLAARPISNYRF